MEIVSLIGDLAKVIPSLKALEIGSMATALTLLIRIYRAIGGPWFPDDKKWAAQILIFGLAFLSTLLLGGFTVGWLPALASAISIASGAVMTNEFTKSVGAAVRTAVPASEQFRSASSLLIPPPKAK
jgi:hypothetical protein